MEAAFNEGARVMRERVSKILRNAKLKQLRLNPYTNRLEPVSNEFVRAYVREMLEGIYDKGDRQMLQTDF